MRRASWQIVGRRLHQVFTGLAFEPLAMVRKARELPNYCGNLRKYRARQHETGQSFRIRFRYLYPALGERRVAAGEAQGHYFHQDLWVARLVFEAAPAHHLDVGSSVGGFVAHLLSFREVHYLDIRPLTSRVCGLTFQRGSMLAMPFVDSSLGSVSALHSPEHVGLGRYGDEVNPNAWLLAIREFTRVLAPGGRLYFSVPIGPERVEFDAHRVFAPQTILDAFRPLTLVDAAFVDDQGDFHEHQSPLGYTGWYGCGIFVFTK